MKYEAQTDIWRTNEAYSKNGAAASSHSRELARFKQVFPLTFFSNEIIIEEHRVILIVNKGPWTDEVITIMATDIGCVNASTGPLFGQVHVKNLTGGPEIFIDKLLKGHVYQARGLIEGIVLTSRGGLKIDTESLDLKRQTLLRFGEVS